MKILMITFQEKTSSINSLNYVIADMISNKKLNPLVTELFITNRKLNISPIFIMQLSSKLVKDVRLLLKH